MWILVLIFLTFLAASTAANPLVSADQLLRTGQVENALEQLLRVESEYNNSSVYYWLLASAYIMHGERDRAVDAALKAFNLTAVPHAVDYRRLGTVLYQADRQLEARAAFEKAYELDPNDMWTVFHLALILHRQGDLHNDAKLLRQSEELWLRLEQIVDVPEEMPTLAYYYLGEIYCNRGDEAKTIYYWQRFFTYHQPTTFEESMFVLKALAYLKSL